MALIPPTGIVSDPRTGRPKLGPLVQNGWIACWASWIVVFMAGAISLFSLYKGRGAEVAITLLAVSLFAAVYHQIRWNRLMRRYRAAVEDYEAGLEKVFADWDPR